MKKQQKISKNQLLRLPLYLNYLKNKKNEGIFNISSPTIAKDLNLSEEKVRKDLSLISSQEGKPNLGRNIDDLIKDIEGFLGYDVITSAALVGVGHLGKALLAYKGFAQYGLNIVMGFDSNPELDGQVIAGKRIYYSKNMSMLCRIMKVQIGIITVPEAFAQGVCDELVEAGVKAIWNFAPTHLNVPDGVIVHNENMAASLAVLSRSIQK